MSKLIIPSVLSYERSIQPTVGYFFSESKDGKLKPLTVETSKLAGPFADYKSSRSKKTPEQLSAANIKEIDEVILPSDAEALVVTFNVSFLSKSLAPYASNNSEFKALIREFMGKYSQKGGTEILAERYAQSIALGLFMWRNIDSASSMTVTVSMPDDTVVFDSPLQPSKRDEFFAQNKDGIAKVSAFIAKGLSQREFFASMKVSARLSMPPGSEVFPSQEFIINKSSKDPSRIYRSVSLDDKRQPIFTMAKIGNAIRTIDNWFPGSEGRSIAVEPFGIDKKNEVAVRIKHKVDFYTLLENKLAGYTQELDDIDDISDIQDPDMHFVAACLIRGGVLSGAGKDQ